MKIAQAEEITPIEHATRPTEQVGIDPIVARLDANNVAAARLAVRDTPATSLDDLLLMLSARARSLVATELLVAVLETAGWSAVLCTAPMFCAQRRGLNRRVEILYES